MKTLGRFILVDNTNKKQLYLQWRTQGSLNRIPQNPLPLPIGYSNRKTIISQLKQSSPQQKKHSSPSKKNLHALTHSHKLRASSSTNQLTPFFYVNPERESTAVTNTNTNTNTKRDNMNGNMKGNNQVKVKSFYRSKSVGRGSFGGVEKVGVQGRKARDAVAQAHRQKGRVLCIFKMRRQGLRYKLRHQFLTVCPNTTHQQLTSQIKKQLFPQFLSLVDRKVYLFHLSGEPINNAQFNIDGKQYIIFADICPKFAIPFDLQMRLFQQAGIVEQQIRAGLREVSEFNRGEGEEEDEEEEEDDQNQTQIYQWQKIKDVKKYVDRLVDNPKEAKRQRQRTQQHKKDEVEIWCAQKYTMDDQKKGEKNPFFDVSCHFPKQTQTQALQLAANRINQLPTTINRHQIKQRPIENMLQKIKQENQESEKVKKMQTDRIRLVGYKSQKQFLRELDLKNVPLIYQNIPYMMEKYGVNRAEVINLYNLYKSLEKVSAMRLFENNQYRRVKQKGIDRKTFDEGLQGLEINPGDEVIRNICYFPEFITWQQFIKIISISMRKTPKSKLQAILQSLGSTKKGYLTKSQITIMVGSSLQKIFGFDEAQLKKYFVNLVMKTLDKDKSGTIEIDELKEHVLEKKVEDLDLVSYLMLNS